MDCKQAIDVLRNTAFLGTERALNDVEMAISTLDKYVSCLDDQEEYVTLSILDEIDKMQEFIDTYPPNYPKHDVLKLEISVAEQLKKIYKILFYIMTRYK